ncbi:MAG: DNA polymerase III subunit gamma/tau [Chitinophagaceae bacterium]|nr:DNA polymerase III subunit gamma/tau [Chitinophagaceae bacterium]
MDKFIVSARKYRPQNFSTVVGQAHITTTLKNAINNNQLAHAFLFCGPRGVGKTTCARILAKTINCETRTKEGEACNTCPSCVSFDAGNSLNIHELDAASNNSVDDIRSLVEQVRFAPQAGRYKVYIVDEVHMLSTAAFNAFLKTLEEPPPYAIFILATTEKHKILPTILSRCQIFDFKRITNNDTVEHLQEICVKENIQADKASLHIIAQKSEGCMRDSLSILDKIVSFTNGQLTYANTVEHLNILDEDYFFKFLDMMQKQQLPDAMLLYDEINAKGFEGDTLIEGFAEFIRNLLVSKDARAAVLLEVADDFKQKYLQIAQAVNTGWLIGALNILNDGEIQYKQARNKRLHIELIIIKLCYLQQAIELSSDEDKITKKKVVEQSKAVSFKALPIVKVKEENKVISKRMPGLRWNSRRPTTDNRQPKNHKLQTINFKPSNQKPETSNHKPQTLNPQPQTSLGSLNKIRQQLTNKKNNLQQARQLSIDELQICWQLFIDQLKERKNHSAVTNFKLSVLKIIDGNTIEIITENNIQQKFIEQERGLLIEHFHQYFNNKQLVYNVIIIETNNDAPVEITLNKKQQYLEIIKEYPLVKELKERLKLELD